MKFSGSNMSYLSYIAGNEMETEIEINAAGTSATCTDVITAPKTVKIYRQEGTGDNEIDVLWFTITLTSSSSSGSNTGGSTGGSTSGGSTVVINDAQYLEAYVNGSKVDPARGTITVYDKFSSLKVTGVNMTRVALWVSGEDEDVGIPMNADGTEATWGGSGTTPIKARRTIDVYAGHKKWFTINVENEPIGD